MMKTKIMCQKGVACKCQSASASVKTAQKTGKALLLTDTGWLQDKTTT